MDVANRRLQNIVVAGGSRLLFAQRLHQRLQSLERGFELRGVVQLNRWLLRRRRNMTLSMAWSMACAAEEPHPCACNTLGTQEFRAEVQRGLFRACKYLGLRHARRREHLDAVAGPSSLSAGSISGSGSVSRARSDISVAKRSKFSLGVTKISICPPSSLAQRQPWDTPRGAKTASPGPASMNLPSRKTSKRPDWM